jgi:glycosyltransferase involved in cell wall biosynthesis
MYRTYGLADAIVAVSDGVGDDVAAFTGLPRERIQTIYNPVVPDDVDQLAAEPVNHPWFLAGAAPVVLGAGRLHQQKDFPTLVRAFARVRKERPVRLVIFGESEHGDTDSQREALMKVAGELGVAEDVSLPGWTANLFAYMARAAVFVLTSRWEGLPTVLIEAMAAVRW